MAQTTKSVPITDDPIEKAQQGKYGPSISRTWLIQRLEIPRGKAVTPFTFGAGGNGGLSREAIETVSPIFSFAYMGAAEYEFGDVPKALNTIAKYCVAGNWVSGNIVLGKDGKEAYYICSKEQREYVEDLIRYLYADRHKGSRVRDWVGLRQTIRFDSPDAIKLRGTFGHNETFEEAKKHLPLGWLELDNGFLFFADREMFEKSCQLFGSQAVR